MTDKTVAELMALAKRYARAQASCATDGAPEDFAENLAAYNALEQAIRRAVDWGEPVAYRREWAGDASDLCQWLYADEYDPKDDCPDWEPLYARNKP